MRPIHLFLGAVALAGSAVASVAQCNADNCYRAMFPCSSTAALAIASQYCATVTAGGTTATNYPTRATSACGTTPDRYISACGCGPTCTTSTPTPTPTCEANPPNNLIINGGFECGLAPWTVQVPDASASAGIVSTGYSSGHSFEVDLPVPSVSTDLGVSARVISNTIPVVSGIPYALRFYTYFDNPDAGFIGVMINDSPIMTVDARDHGWGAWYLNTYEYTTKSTTLTVKFEFLFAAAPSVDAIDGVVIMPA